MERESRMKQAVSAYMSAFVRGVSLDGFAEQEQQEINKAFGAFCARLVTLAERMDKTPHEKAMEYAVLITEAVLQNNKDFSQHPFTNETAEAVGKFVTELARTIERTVEAEEVSPASGWIPVSERMPEEGEIVLVCRRKVDGRLVSGVGKQNGGRWWVYESSAKKVEYWQPVPLPPEQTVRPGA